MVHALAYEYGLFPDYIVTNRPDSLVYRVHAAGSPGSVFCVKLLEGPAPPNELNTLIFLQQLRNPGAERCFQHLAAYALLMDTWVIVTEWVPNSRGPAEPRQAAEYVRQLLRSVASLHALGVCSRDIKPSNCLWDPRDKRLTLVDFELAVLAGQCRGRVGTPGFWAPEVCGPGGGDYDGAKADVFSTGVCIMSFLLGVPETEVEYIPISALLQRFRSIFGPELANLAARLTHPDPTHRPTAAEALDSCR